VTLRSPPLVGLYQRGGMISYTTVLLPPEAAKRLVDELQAAVASPESIALASWPRDVCAFPVTPQTRGKEEYLSIHLDSGPKPYSKWQLRGQAAQRAANFIFWSIGVVASVRWLIDIVTSPHRSTLTLKDDTNNFVGQLGWLAYVVALIGIASVLLSGGDRLVKHLRLPGTGMPVALHVLGAMTLLVGTALAAIAYNSDPSANRIYFLIPILMASIPYGLVLLIHVEGGLLSRIRRKCAAFIAKFR
jgi:hypothetical protein